MLFNVNSDLLFELIPILLLHGRCRVALDVLLSHFSALSLSPENRPRLILLSFLQLQLNAVKMDNGLAAFRYDLAV